MSDIQVVILAAGKGTRMYSKLPKVLHQIGGQSMLQRVINTAQSLTPQAIYVVVGHGQDLVKAHIDAPVYWVEQTEQLGTGHAVKMVMDFLPSTGKTLVLYGDVPLINLATLQKLIEDTPDNQVGLLIDTLPNPTGYGRIIRHATGSVTAIVEEKDANHAQKTIKEVNTGIFLLPNKYLHKWLNQLNNQNAQQEYYLTDIVALAQQDHIAVHATPVDRHYLTAGINNKIQLAELERILQLNQAQALMHAGVGLRDPHRFDLRGTLKHGQDVMIDVNCVFEGEVVLGDDVQIGANCVIKNAIIGNGTKIEAFSHLENCTLGANVKVGPFARLRPNTVLADEVRIGNFVEVKNTQMAKGSKANHLTYLGDSTVGEQSNIGAGTITCNYDGINKHHTTIGNHAFIGSGNMLVAPLEIGDHATTAAGSTITKNCPPNQLTISRSKQTVIEGWTRPIKKE